MSLSALVPLAMLLALLPPALLGSPHPYLTPRTLWLGVGLAALLTAMARERSFFLDMFAILVSAFVLHRLVVLYYWPEALDYHAFVAPSPAAMQSAVWFSLLTAVAAYLGCRLAGLLPRPLPVDGRAPLRLAGIEVPLGPYFAVLAVLVVLAAVVQFGLMQRGFGVAGFQVVGDQAVTFRLAYLAGSAGLLAFVPLLVLNPTSLARRAGVVLVATQILLALASTAKGALVTLVLTFLVCLHFMGRPLRVRHTMIAAASVLSIGFIYGSVATTLRGAIHEGVSWEVVQSSALAEYSWYDLSARLGHLDLLAAIMAVGPEPFEGAISARRDLIGIVNSLIPGEIIADENRATAAFLIPLVLRGFPVPDADARAAHGENLGLLGTAYLYFGFSPGLLFVFVWAYVLNRAINVTRSPLLQILLFYYFLVVFFAGGGLVTPVSRGYEALLTIFVVLAICRVRYRPRSQVSLRVDEAHPEPLRRRTVSLVPARRRTLVGAGDQIASRP